jgi:RNA polymerase sigma-70 factor (ECF subfamily)
MDAETARALFERHHLALFRTLRRLAGDAALAEDLTQEVFARALAAGDGYEERGRERAWLFTIARRLLADHGRRLARRPAHASLDGAEPAGPSVETSDLRLALDRALEQLAEPEREAFLLREVGGLGHEEIARVTAASRAAVRNRIHRARLALREQLRPQLDRAIGGGTRETQR